MKRYIRIIASMLLGGAILGACNGTDYDFSVCEMKVDRDAIVDVAAQNPGQEAVGLTTTAPYWMVQTPDWITPDATTGYGEKSIITFTIASNFKNENTDMAARSGEIKISGGMTSVIITVNQLGYTAPVDPDASIGGITDMDEFKDFVAAVNNGRSLADGEVGKVNVSEEAGIPSPTSISTLQSGRTLQSAFSECWRALLSRT